MSQSKCTLVEKNCELPVVFPKNTRQSVTFSATSQMRGRIDFFDDSVLRRHRESRITWHETILNYLKTFNLELSTYGTNLFRMNCVNSRDLEEFCTPTWPVRCKRRVVGFCDFDRRPETIESTKIIDSCYNLGDYRLISCEMKSNFETIPNKEK